MYYITLEDILMYIIIVCCCTPIGDVCYSFTRCLNCVQTLWYNLHCKSGQQSLVCYHQPCSCLCVVDLEWMVEGPATKDVELRLPRLPNGWLSRRSRQSSLYVILAQNNKGETQIYSQQERSDLDTRSDQIELRYIRCKVKWKPQIYGGCHQVNQGFGLGFRECEA